MSPYKSATGLESLDCLRYLLKKKEVSQKREKGEDDETKVGYLLLKKVRRGAQPDQRGG